MGSVTIDYSQNQKLSFVVLAEHEPLEFTFIYTDDDVIDAEKNFIQSASTGFLAQPAYSNTLMYFHRLLHDSRRE